VTPAAVSDVVAVHGGGRTYVVDVDVLKSPQLVLDPILLFVVLEPLEEVDTACEIVEDRLGGVS
jgi:hypothetical protein